MTKHRTTSRLIAILIGALTSLLHAQIIPQPVKIEQAESAPFEITTNTTIVSSGGLQSETRYLQKTLQPAMGFKLPIARSITEQNNKSLILLQLDRSLSALGDEGYKLFVTTRGVAIKAPKPAGIFYGIQSLRQLLPPAIFAKDKQDVAWTIESVTIADQPRFSWRAFMLDEARHFKGEKEVKKLLDQMAALKMNVFHWHLTDDQGWRIEIKKYPKLTSIGSKRKDSEIGGWYSNKFIGKPHEGFYTQEQIKDIVAYAQERHINIVPEIGMPGHASAAIASYQWLGMNDHPIEVPSTFGKLKQTYNPSSERVYQAMADIFDELYTLFPSRIIHIGGDEVDYGQWRNSKEVKKWMKKNKLETMADVQIAFTNRIASIVERKGHNIMGWNEILGDDVNGNLGAGQEAKAAKLSPNTVIHFWKGSSELAKRAIKKGHNIVNSWHSYTYLDYGYGQISLEKAYNFDPVFGGLTKEEQKRIIGTGCQMWSEWIPTVELMELRVYPRLAAYAEGGWTAKENKDFSSFRKRMKNQLQRWDLQNIKYAKDQVSRVTAQDFFNHTKIDTWNPEKTPSSWKAVEFGTAGKIKAATTYEIVFLYKQGAHALEIKGVELLEDGKVVSTDTHTGFSGSRLNGCVYEVKLPAYKAGSTYTIRASIKGRDGTDSHGIIKLMEK